MRMVISTLVFAFFWLPLCEAASQNRSIYDRPIKIVAFGTSLTARGGWTEALRIAVKDCLGYSVQVVAIAKSGATSSWGVSVLDQVKSEHPDIVLIELYANDAALHRFVSQRQSQRNLTQIVEDLQKHFPDVRILILAMNPFHGLHGFIRPYVQHYIDAHRSVATAKQIEFVDLRPRWLQLPREDLATAIPDGAHPLPEWTVRIAIPAIAAQIASKKNCPEENHGANTHPLQKDEWGARP